MLTLDTGRGDLNENIVTFLLHIVLPIMILILIYEGL
jgi:hypothetical protein